MKKALIIFAWVSIVGSFGDGLIALYCFYLALFDTAVGFGIGVEDLIRNHISFLLWVKEIAYYVLPSEIAHWIFSLPALVYFPIRVFSSLVIGWWILRIAEKIPPFKPKKTV